MPRKFRISFEIKIKYVKDYFAGISKSSYYKWLNRVETKRDKENSVIIKELIKIYDDVNGIYGYRCMTMNINLKLLLRMC